MTTTVTRTRRLTGFQPTGELHLGNLLGAMRPLIAAQDRAESIALIADLHALTREHDPDTVRARTLDQARVLIAAGVDPDRTSIVVQSRVPAHVELHYLLECVTHVGEASRMIQYKEKSTGPGPVRLSLLTYPVLMAADILVHEVTEVPVGDDQDQHLELARTVATRFNTRYGRTFTVPVGVHESTAPRVMDLADPRTKMGKSHGTGAGRIGLLDPPEVVRRAIIRAVTDTVGIVRREPSTQPGVSNLLTILAACGDSATPTSYGQLKRDVVDAVEAVLAPIRRRYAELADDPAYVAGVLDDGVARVRERTSAVVHRTKLAIGLLT
jgi:tryptophanyl-tRNA synthetase